VDSLTRNHICDAGRPALIEARFVADELILIAARVSLLVT
jgi:hypothetical protein